MNHDNYDNQLLKALQGIDKSLRIIANHYKNDALNKIADKDGIAVDLSKSFFEQDLPCCHNCKFADLYAKRCIKRFNDLQEIDYVCCTDYEKYSDNPYQE